MHVYVLRTFLFPCYFNDNFVSIKYNLYCTYQVGKYGIKDFLSILSKIKNFNCHPLFLHIRDLILDHFILI